MHRGGTSAIAGMLHRLGVNFGPRLMPANADNPAGYYEHNDVVNLHDRFLGRLGAAWDDPFPPEFDADLWPDLAPAPGLPSYRDELLSMLRRDFAGGDGRPPAPFWGLKDPRLCLLLPWWAPLWARLGAEPHFLVVLRSPEAVAASLGRRDGFSPAKANLLWLQHLLRAERATRGQSRCFVDYDGFLADWQTTLDRVSKSLGVPWPRTPASLAPTETGFLDPALRHHVRSPPVSSGPSGAGLSWVEIARGELFPDGTDETRVLDALHGEMARARQVCGPPGGRHGPDLDAQLQAQRRLTRWYEEEWQKALQKAREADQRLERRDQKIRSLQARPSKG